MADRVSFTSEALQGAAYEPETETLTVTFRSGSSYDYEGVPEGIWQQFKEAASAGTFWRNNIKDVY